MLKFYCKLTHSLITRSRKTFLKNSWLEKSLSNSKVHIEPVCNIVDQNCMFIHELSYRYNCWTTINHLHCSSKGLFPYCIKSWLEIYKMEVSGDFSLAFYHYLSHFKFGICFSAWSESLLSLPFCLVIYSVYGAYNHSWPAFTCLFAFLYQ